MKTKKILKSVAAAAVLALAVGAFLCPSSAGPAAKACSAAAHWLFKLQPAATWWFLGVLAATLLAGRLFCECLCPLGVSQSLANFIFHPRTKVRRVCTRLPQGKMQLAVRLAALAAFCILAAAGAGALAWALSPYSIFGKAFALFVPGIAIFCAILATAAAGKGRFWCNWICPAGTLFTFLSRFSLSKHKIGEGCANCKACFGRKDGAEKGNEAGPAATRRDTLKGFAALAAVETAEKTTDGGFAPVSLHDRPDRETPILPPGAVDRGEFNLKCVACGLCVGKCRGGCLTQSLSLKRFGQPEMDFRKGWCLAGCKGECSVQCPTGAIRPLGAAKRTDVHTGVATWTKDRCIRETEGVQCTACSRKCPVKAIHIVNGFPFVDAAKCIGCGACEHVCPSRPLPAIIVKGYESQRIVVPRDPSIACRPSAICRRTV